ncbi:MAG: flagellar hook-associated protein FlgL, partial [Pseudobdellovibrio sp.]
MRISDKMLQSQSMNNLNKTRSELSSLQNQAATLKRVTKPSDDPTGMAKVLETRTENKKLEQFDKNIFFAKSFLDVTESTLAQLGDAVVRAKELALQAASDTNSGLPRQMIGSEVGQIFNSVVEMSNRKFGDRYIFAGYKTTATPFSGKGEYAGDDGNIRVQNLSGQYVPINLPGSMVFLGEGLSFDQSVSHNEESAPKTVEDLQKYKVDLIQSEFLKEEAKNTQEDVPLRGPANAAVGGELGDRAVAAQSYGVNIFSTISGLESALKTNDKTGVQASLDALDQALNQINLARAEIGGRINQLNASSEGIQK